MARRDGLDVAAAACVSGCDTDGDRLSMAVSALELWARGEGHWRQTGRFAHRRAVVMLLVADGLEAEAIAVRLGCSARTVASDVQAVRGVLGVRAVGSHG
jgi:DNA-binding NarL/FixJ family response regulator